MMFKSIFQKFIFTYISITMISLLFISGTLSYFFEKYVFEQRKDALIQNAEYVNELIRQVHNKEIDKRTLMESIKTIENSENVQITILSRGGRNTGIGNVGRSPIEMNIVKQFMNDREQEMLQYYEELSGVRLLTIGLPVASNNQRTGAVLVFSPIQNFEEWIGQINRIIWILFICISVPAALLLYWFSRKFSLPMIHMSKAADHIAKGDFSRRVEVKGKDEVAQLGKSLNDMADKIKQLEEMRKDLIANVSHELKTPLTTIQNFIQAILDDIIPRERTKEYLQVAGSETERLGKLVNELIELSLYEKKQMQIYKKTADLAGVIHQVAKQLEMELTKKDIDLVMELQEHLFIRLDAEKFKQVLLNILSNAIRHTPEHGEIGINVIKDPGMGKVVLRIWDTGCGIDKENLPYIFERFYKADKSRGQAHGAGIGLTISKHIVEAHGGSIAAESEVGKGTTMIITMNLEN
jgi:signal transduction histidine kinase